MVLTRQGSSLLLQIERTRYGVYHNGKKAEMREEIKKRGFLFCLGFFLLL